MSDALKKPMRNAARSPASHESSMRISLQSGLNVGNQLVAQFGVATKDHSDVRNDVLNDADLLLISERFAQFGQFA